MLHHVHLHVFDGLARAIVYDDLSSDPLAVVVDLLVERHLQVDLTAGEGEALRGHRAGQTEAALKRSMLQFLDGQIYLEEECD